MTAVWFTADSHYNHRNIIEYCARPFAAVEEMNETLVRNWNALVQPGDVVTWQKLPEFQE